MTGHNAVSGPGAKSRPPYNRFFWAFCVILSVVPLALFVLVIWIFESSEQHLVSPDKIMESIGDEELQHAAAHVGIATLDYGVHVYVHIAVSLVATIYFLVSLHRRARARSYVVKFEISFGVLFSLAMIVAVYYLTLFPAFGSLFVSPFVELFRHLMIEDPLARPFAGLGSLSQFLILLPALFGIFAVVICSSTFHHFVCSRRGREADDWQDDFVDCVTTLKLQLSFLSLVLVSSVVTSRNYAYLLPYLIDPQLKSARHTYAELASTLSFASSMLFTAVLFFAFAPGVFLLLKDVSGVSRNDTHKEIGPMIERLKFSELSGRITNIAHILLTLAAPALASALMDALAATT